jgi:hypothetical protein
LSKTPHAFSLKGSSLVNATVIEIEALEFQADTNAAMDTLICIGHPFIR